jgi:hypothetical protein
MIFIIFSPFVKAIFKYGSAIVFTTKRSEPSILLRFFPAWYKASFRGRGKNFYDTPDEYLKAEALR